MNKKMKIIIEIGVVCTVFFLLFSTGSSTIINDTERLLIFSTEEIRDDSYLSGREDDMVWDNGPPGVSGFLAQIDDVYPVLFNVQAADDFMFEYNTEICGISWYGFYFDEYGIIENPCDFNIYIFADNGTGLAPTGGGMDDPERTALVSYTLEQVLGEHIIGNNYYYEVNLAPVFHAQHDVKYWISIQAAFEYRPKWVWSITSEQPLLSPTVVGNLEFQYGPIHYWTSSVEYGQNFYLFGESSTDTALDVVDVSGGLGVTATVSNVGEFEALDVEIWCNISGGLLGLVDEYISVPPFSLGVGSDEVVDSDTFFGLGPIEVEVTVWASNADNIICICDGFIIGPFVLLNDTS